MVHDVKNDDGIKTFFMEMYDSYIKVYHPSWCFIFTIILLAVFNEPVLQNWNADSFNSIRQKSSVLWEKVFAQLINFG